MKRFAFILFALTTYLCAQAAQAADPKTYDLTICRYDTMFFPADNDVFMILYTEDNTVTLRLDIFLEEGQDFFTNGKTYTWDDMYHKFCYAYVAADFTGYYFADASFTWRLDEHGLEHIEGSAIDSLGNTYNFHYDVLPFIPTGDTIEVTFSHVLELEHAPGYEDWYFTGSEAPYYILLTLMNKGNSPVGHYTSENIETDYSYIEKNLGNGEFQQLYFHDASIDVTVGADDTLHLEAAITAEDGNVYLFHMAYAAPKPLKKETITATNLYVNTDYLYGLVEAFRMEASDKAHAVFLVFSPTGKDRNIYDTYHISNISSHMGGVTDYYSAEDDTSPVYEGTVTVEKTETGTRVTGTILCYNNVEYTLDLSYAAPDKTRQEELTMNELELKMSVGAWRISGYSADKTQFISLVFNGFGIVGTYDIATMSMSYSYVVTDIIWEATEIASYTYFDLKDADLTVLFDERDSIVTVTGTILVQNMGDVPEYTICLSNQPRTEDIAQHPALPATATKRLKDGILIIEKEGTRYNVLGNIIR